MESIRFMNDALLYSNKKTNGMDYKLSYYVITTEQMPGTDIQIIYSTKTSKAFNIKSKYIDLILKSKFDKLPIEILQMMINAEIIVDSDLDEMEDLMDNAIINSTEENTDYFQYTVMSSANCQLGCNYCGQQHSKAQMDDEMVQLTLNRIEYNVKKLKVKHLHIAWFGGEPLMAYSRMRKINSGILDLQKIYGFNYTSNLVSNGLSLKSHIYTELAEKFNCVSIEITLDGSQEFHDKRRDTKQHKETFETIFSNIVNITSLENFPINNCEIRIRCNVDDNNKEGVIPLIDLLAHHSLQQKIFFYTAPVYSWGNDAHLNTSKEEYAISEIDYFMHLNEKGFTVYPLPETRKIVCAAVTPNFELIDPWGKVFNCTEIPLVPMYGKEFEIGDLRKDPEAITNFEDRPYTNWYQEIKSKEHGYWCSSCKILPLCGGRCPKSWKDGIPPCPSMKFNMEDRLALSYYATERLRHA